MSLSSTAGRPAARVWRYRSSRPTSRAAGSVSWTCPVLLLQGLDDPIVPPAQAELFRDALVRKGIPHAYRAYEGESQGFRRAATIIDAYQSEISFCWPPTFWRRAVEPGDRSARSTRRSQPSAASTKRPWPPATSATSPASASPSSIRGIHDTRGRPGASAQTPMRHSDRAVSGPAARVAQTVRYDVIPTSATRSAVVGESLAIAVEQDVDPRLLRPW